MYHVNYGHGHNLYAFYFYWHTYCVKVNTYIHVLIDIFKYNQLHAYIIMRYITVLI